MNINEVIHGFRVTERRDVPELEAVLWRMTYEKNGAELCWLDRADENKTFAIAFKTIPQDDTGVFHILEHSVLCGSEKYPVKEPFVELLKSSLQTFLNALTFPDKTMYPVASRNDQDFLNLIDVYMDAVLHPLSISDPHAFLQEGWHYELDAPDGELIRNGVVYNEMKGAFASQDEVLQSGLNRLLFPDNCYGCESGGHPDHIPELTYENYLESHRKYYHPSNSRIFLDGMVDADAVLAKLDEYLSAYDYLAVDSDIPMQLPVSPDEEECLYEVSEGDADKLILAEGWVYGDYTDRKKTYAFNILSEVLAGSNEAPLTKAILEDGLAVDVDFQALDGIQQPYVVLVLRNVPEGKRAEAYEKVEEIFRGIVAQGVDKKRLRAALNRLEFLTREKDYGTMPRGLIYAMESMDSWLYGGDPMQNLLTSAVFAELREAVETDYFEEILRTCILENPHRAKLTLLPSRTLGEEKAAKERAELAAVKASWTKEQTLDVIERFRVLREKQGRKDTEEELASLPVLALSDVPEEVRETPLEELEIAGVRVLHPEVATNGILYLDLYFDLSDLTVPELQQARFMARMLGEVATTHYDVNALQGEIDEHLGRLSANVTVLGKAGDVRKATPYLTVNVALLESRKAEAVCILREVLMESQFTDREYLYNELRQGRISMEQSIIGGGNSYARQRVAARFSVLGALTEALMGIDLLRWMQELEAGYEQQGEAFSKALTVLSRKVFARERLLIGVTGPLDEAWIAELAGLMYEAPMGEPIGYTVREGAAGEGFKIPASVSFTAKGANLYALESAYSGTASVAAQILTYGFLWNTIRVKGGAYGTGLRLALNGDALFSSYRDPSGNRSVCSFDEAGEALRAFCAGDERLDKYIISTIGGQEPLLTPRMEGKRAMLYVFLGQSAEDRRRIRAEILHTTKEDLLRTADQLDEVCRKAGVCVIGGAEILEACGDRLETVEMLQRS
ncbi:MAG: insulinase family protein [Mogibacterium sp.]|nr:insulinase family protein [Mogibacterium sp.]